jgi:o-succinylbenzoate synthase
VRTAGWSVLAYELALRRPLVTARGTVAARAGLLLRLTDSDGVDGWGEAAPMPEHGGADLARTAQALDAMVAELGPTLASVGDGLPVSPSQLGAVTAALAPRWPDAGAALAAVATALADLAARRAGVSLARWLSPAARPTVWLAAVVGAVAPARAARQAVAALGQGYRTIKVKVGTDEIADLERVAMVRAAVGQRARLRADANGAWDPLVAEVMLDALAAHDLEFVEQPVPADQIAALAQLRRRGAVPVAADEALLVPGGVEAVLDREAADVLAIKPSLLGGPARALEIAGRAAERGMAVVVGSAVESAVGRAMALHCAAALPQTDLASGLGTADLLAADTAVGPVPDRGQLRLPTGVGLGVTVHEPGGWVRTR